jgi:phosphorylcholine metabolism protein LicD
MGCTANTEKCKFNRKTDNVPLCCKRKIIRMLRLFAKLADQHSITYFLDFGTLLGCCRNGLMIPYDHDADVSVLVEDRDKIEALSSELNVFGHQLDLRRPGLYRIYYSKKNRLYIDLFFRYLDDRDFYLGRPFCQQMVIYPMNLYPLQKMVFEGIDFWVPQKALEYLKNYYGADCIEVLKRRGEYAIENAE